MVVRDHERQQRRRQEQHSAQVYVDVCVVEADDAVVVGVEVQCEQREDKENRVREHVHDQEEPRGGQNRSLLDDAPPRLTH